MRPGFLLAMAWRETRAARRRMLLLVAAVAVGVAALVAVNSFTANLRDAIDREGRALLGADLRLSSRTPLPPRAEDLIDSLAGETVGALCQAGECGLTEGDVVARRTDFDAMAYVARTSGTRFVRVNAVAGPYPFYGTIVTAPAGRWDSLDTGRNAIVDPALLTSLGAEVGDTLILGEGRFAISATAEDIPGAAGVESAFSPRVFISARWLDETKLITFGSRVSYRAYLRLAGERDADAVADDYGPILRPERVRLWTAERNRADTLADLDQLGRYLGLVALIALLLGGLGIASAVNVFIRNKRETIAVLRCLGATSRQVFATYLTQAVAMGLAGSVIGTALGLGIQYLLPVMVHDFLPVNVEIRAAPAAVATGLAAGLWVASIFALLPLMAVRLVTPLAALRAPYQVGGRRRGSRDPWRWLVVLALVLSVVALSVAQAPSVIEGLGFAGGIGLTLLVLWLAAFLLTRTIRRHFPRRWHYVYRQGLANLYRPANQTVSLVLALGFGTFLLSTLFLVQANLLRQLRFGGEEKRPNLVMFDIQPDQIEPVRQTLDSMGHPLESAVAMVPMRVQAIRGWPVLRGAVRDSVTGDTIPDMTSWAFRREYRSTYRDSLAAAETIVAGEWWPPGGAGSGPVFEVSLDKGIATELGVALGDTITWNVQGMPVDTRVTSLREVDWARFEPNFFAVFQPAALAGAPHMFVTLTRVEDAGERGRIQRVMAERFPNVSSVDLALVQRTLDRIVGSIILAIRFMALFSLATGAVVLIGAVATSRFQRVRESVLLKTLGGTRRQILRVLVTEYIALGTLAAVVSVGLSTVAAWALMRFVFHETFNLPALQLGGLGAGLVIVTTAVGLWNSGEVFRAPPLAVLREE